MLPAQMFTRQHQLMKAKPQNDKFTDADFEQARREAYDKAFAEAYAEAFAEARAKAFVTGQIEERARLAGILTSPAALLFPGPARALAFGSSVEPHEAAAVLDHLLDEARRNGDLDALHAAATAGEVRH